jgi:uncharacterized protein (DUF4415 family)
MHVYTWHNTCMEQKEAKEKITFVFPKDVLDAMRKLAKDHQRSLIGEIIWALRQYINQQQGKGW